VEYISFVSSRRFRLWCVLIVSLVLIPFGLSYAYEKWEQYHYVKAIPAELAANNSILIESSSGLLEGCGVAIYELSPKSRKDIEQGGGLTFLANARQGRGYPKDPFYSYAAWRETPVPSSWFESTELAGFACVQNRVLLYRTIADALTSHGSYFTTTPGGTLIVSPQRQIIILVHFG
jgi:hypothetical protein